MKPGVLASLYSKVAKKVLAETISLRKGETLTIETWNNGLPMALSVALEAKSIGAIPLITYEDEETYLAGIKAAPKDALGLMGKHEYGLLAGSDAYVFIPGPPIGTYHKRITRQEYADSTRYNESWYEAAEKAKVRGARLTYGYIGADMAGVLGKDVDEIVGHQLKAALVDFKGIGRKGREIAARLKDGAWVSLKGRGTDIRFEVKGEMTVQDGVADAMDVGEEYNLAYVPPGYVYKGIDGSTVSGRISLSPTLTRFGVLQDATLAFTEGRAGKWSSAKSPAVMKKLLEALPEKARVPAALTIGLNPAMGFGYGQDRMPAGSVAVVCGITGILREATLSIDGKAVVRGGKLL
jgi:aminopeptidase